MTVPCAHGEKLCQYRHHCGARRRSFGNKQQEQGVEAMGSLYPAGERRRSSRGALANGITRMMTNSLFVYFAANFAQRSWALLNSDVGQFIRRK